MPFALLSIFGICIFTLGVPYGLYRAARSVCAPRGGNASAEQYDNFSLLFSSYQSKYWYFEAVDLLRKLLNTSVVAVVLQGTDLQIWFSALCASCSLFAYTLLQPYADPFCNRLQLIAMLHLSITNLSANLFISQAYFSFYCSTSGSDAFYIFLKLICRYNRNDIRVNRSYPYERSDIRDTKR